MGWAAVATLFAAAVGSWYTALGEGPFASSNSLTQHEPFILLQVFIASAMFTLYGVSVVLESLRSAERRLQEVAMCHELVTENSRDAIILADFNGHRTYVSAAVQRLVGWTTEEFAKLKTLDLVHPEDRPKAEALVRQLHSGAEDAMIECRAKRRNGEYIWVEASLRVVRDPKTGAASKLLNIVRDMTERKHAEQKLQEAYNAVEALAVTDALTGLANRRRFDQGLAIEWRRGLRDRKPLSLLMIDADLFKSYNDTYGHPRGDNCLKQIAESALDVVARPGDLVARFGGEEFAVILPNTGSEGAVQVANEICEALRSRRMPHRGNPHGIMTVSVGCATMVPSFGLHSVNLVELADAALYQAKRNGRNQVCDGNSMNADGSSSDESEDSREAVAKTA
jgi:diguanylate cyclase (GGDEF)-like protein/PAS domain S-box-containing protein